MGVWSVFSSCTTRAGCTFIYPGDGLTTETLILVPSGASAVAAPEQISRHSSTVPPAAGPKLFFAWMSWLPSAPPEVLDWVWVPAGISGYLKRRLELLWKFLSCSREFLHFCASSFWGILSLKGKSGVWSQLGLLIASPSTYWKLVDTLSVAALNFKELPVSLDEGRRNLLQFVLMQKPELGSWFLILKPGRMMD